ncbi:hypothetical protein DESC_610077 [Desulfosarcina cetonica]|nr:hypothetical protein DESC_610077 [Desulfosarcina cetonica]
MQLSFMWFPLKTSALFLIGRNLFFISPYDGYREKFYPDEGGWQAKPPHGPQIHPQGPGALPGYCR